MELKERNKQIAEWAKKHPILAVLAVLFIIGFFSIILSGGGSTQQNINKPSAENTNNSPVKTAEAPAQKITTKTTETQTPAPIQVKQADENILPVSSETISQKNAVKKAKSYLGYSAFSHDGLVAQLEYEQFSHADAVYGADNSGANWNEQAAKKAKQYMDQSSFSRGSLIEQLKYEKFTQEQAEYGASAVGL